MHMQSECLPRQPDEVKRLFVEEFGKTPDELYAEFNYEPIAAASLAQVFKAKCKDGRDVAVKVQYIDLIKRFNGDFATIQFLQSIIKRIHTNFDFSWILNDLRRNLEQVNWAYISHMFEYEFCWTDHSFVCRNWISSTRARMPSDVRPI